MTVDTKELRRLLAEATPGPWSRTKSGDAHWLREVRDENGGGIAFCGHGDVTRAHSDSLLIMSAINALPELLDELDALRKTVAAREVRPAGAKDGGFDGECG
jgi:hypothetical protein